MIYYLRKERCPYGASSLAEFNLYKGWEKQPVKVFLASSLPEAAEMAKKFLREMTNERVKSFPYSRRPRQACYLVLLPKESC